MSTVLSDFTMADLQAPSGSLDYLQSGLDFDNGFGFSPATTPARDQAKQDYGGYFSSALNDSTTFLDQNEGEFFQNYTSLAPQSQTSGFPSVNAKLVNGQVTPPSDNSPITPKREAHNEPTPVSLDDFATKVQPVRKKRGGQGSQSEQASTNSTSKRRKTSSGRKAASASSTGKEEKDEKRSKFLERNRVAASKCRQKKKEWTSNLEQKGRELQQNKAQLTLLVSSLRDEVLYLKSEVLKHDSCNCTALRNYMNRTVSQISGETPSSVNLPVSATHTPVQDLDLDGMSFAGSPPLTVTGSSPSIKASSPI